MVSQLSAAEVADLLRREKIISEKGISLIVDNEIDGQTLLLLKTDEDLKEIGIRAVGDKLRVLAFISKHRTKSVTPAAQTDHVSSNILSEQQVSIITSNEYDHEIIRIYFFCCTKWQEIENPSIIDFEDEDRHHAVSKFCSCI